MVINVYYYKKVKLDTLLKDIFDKKLQSSQHFITTPGLTASMESFSYETPASFLLPWNLSQWKILKIFISLIFTN